MGNTKKEVMIVEIETEGMVKEAVEIYELAEELREKVYKFTRKTQKIKLKEAPAATDASE